MTQTDDQAESRRLRWQCRRGMLELDTLLDAFVTRSLPDLDLTQRRHFSRLLETADPQLHDWLMARAEPPDPALRDLVQRIRAAAADAAQEDLGAS